MYAQKVSHLCMYILGALIWIFTCFKVKEELKLLCHPKWTISQVRVGKVPHTH
jgi:hypothetical protein